eukprot:12544648-Alexandrium_andersonii.AAC.1
MVQCVKPTRNEPQGVLKDASHAPGGSVGGDEVRRRGVPLNPVSLLEVPVEAKQEGRDPEERSSVGS